MWGMGFNSWGLVGLQCQWKKGVGVRVRKSGRELERKEKKEKKTIRVRIIT